jgi:hypothetical protein
MGSREVDALLNNYNVEYKTRWEQVRWLGYINAALVNEKIKKPQDVLKFKWDIEEKEKAYTKEELVQEQYKLINIFNKK